MATMGSTRDFLYSSLSDALLPITRQLLTDVVMEVLNERQVPTRTDYQELRNVVNGFRTKAASSAKAHKGLEKRLNALEKQVADLQTENAALREQLTKPKPRRTRKKPSSS